MNLTSDSFKTDIHMLNYIACELANIPMGSTVDTSKDIDHSAESLKRTMCMIANMLQSQGLNLEKCVKTKRSKPKLEDIIMLKSMRMLAKSIETFMVRNMVLVTMLDIDRVDYMKKVSFLIELIEELEVKHGGTYE